MRVPGRQERWTWWLERPIRGLRNGIDPRSYVGHYLAGRPQLRYKGVSVRSQNRQVMWWLSKGILELGEYDLPGFVPEPGWRVVDVGANIGIFAMLAASRGATVTSYEPDPDVFPCLQANTRKWGVDCRRAAVVGAPRDSVTLYVREGRDTFNSVLSRDVEGTEMPRAVEVPAVSISEVLRTACDLLKIDIEGGEFEVFTAGRESLRNAARLIAEIHPSAGDADDAARDVEAAGFDVTLHEPPAHGGAYRSLTAVRRSA
jgi:FkbM family methyltransferase